MQYSENIICKLFDEKYQRWIGYSAWTDELCWLVKIFIFCCRPTSLFYIDYRLVNKDDHRFPKRFRRCFDPFQTVVAPKKLKEPDVRLFWDTL